MRLHPPQTPCKMLRLRVQRQRKGPEIGAALSHLSTHSARACFVAQLPTSGRQADLIGQSVWQLFLHLGFAAAPSQMLLFVTRTLSRWAVIVEWTLPSHQALFSPGNHPCPYVCSPGSCHDNSLCLIRLLFMEWHLNDHFMNHTNVDKEIQNGVITLIIIMMAIIGHLKISD